MRWIGMVIVLLGLGLNADAQKILLLEKTKKFKRIRYFEGDPIAFRVDNDKYAITGRLDMILDNGVVVDGELYRFESITMVLNFKKYAVFRALSKSALYAIPPMLLFTVLHRGLNSGEKLLIDRNSLQVMGVMAAIGVVLWPFKARKYRLGKKWQLRTLDITPG